MQVWELINKLRKLPLHQKLWDVVIQGDDDLGSYPIPITFMQNEEADGCVVLGNGET